MKQLKKQHEEILKAVVGAYLTQKNEISSALLVKNYGIKFSPAKVRYLMTALEDEGLLVKETKSSGRKPTNKGLEYYAKFLSNAFDLKLINNLEKIFLNRKDNIYSTIEEVTKELASLTGATFVTKFKDPNLILKSINLFEVSESLATIILVVSNGEVLSRKIDIPENKAIKISDLKIAMNIFQDNLIDCKLIDLEKRILLLKDILAEKIIQYEDVIESYVKSILGIGIKSQIYGRENIILSRKIAREDVNEILNILEKNSIWDALEKNSNDFEEIRISINSKGAFFSKRIDENNNLTEISAVAPNESDSNSIKSGIMLLTKIITNNINEKEKDKNERKHS